MVTRGIWMTKVGESSGTLAIGVIVNDEVDAQLGKTVDVQ